MSARLRRDDGLTLIELMVAGLLLALVFGVIVGVMISTITAQNAVSTISSGTNNAQVTASAIDSRIRNSSEFQVTTHGADQMLVARVAGSGSTITWTCYAWYYSAADGGSIRMTTSTPGTDVVAPTPAQLAGWTLLVEGVSPRTGTTIFTASGSQLAVAFNATADDQQPIAIDFTTARLSGVAEASTCY